MATTFGGQYGRNLQMEMNYGTVRQDIVRNQSVIRVWVVLRSNGYASFRNITAPLTLNVNGGGAIENVTLNFGTNSTVTIFQKEYTITHNPDGTKTVPLSATLDINTAGYGSASTAVNYSLASIARSSTVSVGHATIGGTLSILINRKNPSAKHTIRYGFGSASGTIATNVDTSYTWNVPNDLGNQIPDSNASKGTIWVDTYQNGTKTGTSAAVFDISIPDNVKPSFSGVSLIDTNEKAQAIFPNKTTFIQEVSKIKVSFSGASGVLGSSITNYEAIIVGKNYSINQNGGTFDDMNFSGTAIVRARVQDSRGRWSDPKDIQINILPYHRPRLSFRAVRDSDEPTKVNVKREAIIAPLLDGNVQKNRMSLSFKSAKGNSANFIADTGPVSGIWTNQSAVVSEASLNGSYSLDSSWVVEGVLEDSFFPATFRDTVPTEGVAYSYDKDNRFAIGKIVNRGVKGSLDVAGDIYANGKPIQQHALFSGNPSKGFLERVGSTAPSVSGFAWGVISSFFSRWSANGVFSSFYTTENEATQTWTSHDGGAQFGRYRSYSTGEYTAFKAVGIDNFYPVGAIHITTTNTNPSQYMGGTWERFGNGRVLVGVNESDSDFNAPSKTGGSKTISDLRKVGSSFGLSSTASYAGRTVVSTAKNNNSEEVNYTPSNMPPYITVYMWRRTA